MSEWVGVGSNVWYRTHTCSHQEGPSGALVRFGGGPEAEAFDHDKVCVGVISWCPVCKGPTWDLVSLEPLHVEPSIQTTCAHHEPHHGFIRDGVWTDA